MKHELVCIACPKSCELSIDEYCGKLQISGNQCERGIAFAERETNDPQRILTTTVKLTTGGLLPVRSDRTVKKGELKMLVQRLKTITAVPPVEIGQVIVAGVGENSVDIIASDTVE